MLIDEAIDVAKELIDNQITDITIKYDRREASWKVTVDTDFLYVKDIKAVLEIAKVHGNEVVIKLAESEIDIYTSVAKPVKGEK